MKQIIALILPAMLWLAPQSLLAQQVPPSFSYQAVVRDAQGVPMTTTVTFRLSILENDPGGATVYQEVLPRTPNEFGIVTINVGQQDPAAFNMIDWRNHFHYLQVEMDSGNGFEEMGSPQQILSVPYSFYSERAEYAVTDNDWTEFGPDLYRTSGNVGIGTDTPAQPLQVESDETGTSAGVIRGNYTGTGSYDGVGVYGSSVPTDYYGIGGSFTGGYRGVAGYVNPTGDDFYYGVYGYASGGSGVNYGVYGYAAGSGTNYAGYFNGELKTTGTVNLGSSTLDGTSTVNVRGSLSVYNSGDDRLHWWTNSANGSGYYEAKGPNGLRNIWISSVSGSENHGYLAVCDASGTAQAGMYVNSSGQGILFKDVDNFRMEHPEDPNKEIWYAAIEGPEAGAYERGTATLSSGEVFVPYSDHFQLVVNPSTVTVVLTPHSADTYGLAVVEKTETGFWVKELQNGTGNFSFDWEVKGVRQGYEDYEVIRDRLEFSPETGFEPVREESSPPDDPKLK